MSDFDDVLERLVLDPAFKAQLASDPRSALAGYRLSPDEVRVLEQQISGDPGEQHRVETRTSKASLFGLLSPVAGMGTSLGDAASTLGGGRMDDVSQGIDSVQAGFGPGTSAGFGTVYQSSFDDGFPAGLSPDLTPGDPRGGIVGALFDHGLSGQTPESGFGPADLDFDPPDTGIGQQQSGFGAAVPPLDNYHTRVDVDGDGKWDDHVYVARADGGVDIVVDMNHDGRADFIGRDFDRNGLIDESVMDTNHDGVMDTQYEDVNGDGWLDKRVPYDPNGQGQAGSHIGRHRAAEGGH